jgi:hypothetical protein
MSPIPVPTPRDRSGAGASKPLSASADKRAQALTAALIQALALVARRRF